MAGVLVNTTCTTQCLQGKHGRHCSIIISIIISITNIHTEAGKSNFLHGLIVQIQLKVIQ